MAPTKGKGGSAKGKTTSSKSSIKKTSKPTSRSSSSSKRSTKPPVRQPSKENKPKPGGSNTPKKKKKRVYTEKELGIPTLNTIRPAGIQKPKGGKKGKVFVDDQESMMTILAMVNADKEGQIESKMMKARQMEEIRQARQKELEARQQEKKSKLEDTKNSLRRQKNRKVADSSADYDDKVSSASRSLKSSKKRVSFA